MDNASPTRRLQGAGYTSGPSIHRSSTDTNSSSKKSGWLASNGAAPSIAGVRHLQLTAANSPYSPSIEQQHMQSPHKIAPSAARNSGNMDRLHGLLGLPVSLSGGAPNGGSSGGGSTFSGYIRSSAGTNGASPVTGPGHVRRGSFGSPASSRPGTQETFDRYSTGSAHLRTSAAFSGGGATGSGANTPSPYLQQRPQAPSMQQHSRPSSRQEDDERSSNGSGAGAAGGSALAGGTREQMLHRANMSAEKPITPRFHPTPPQPSHGSLSSHPAGPSSSMYINSKQSNRLYHAYGVTATLTAATSTAPTATASPHITLTSESDSNSSSPAGQHLDRSSSSIGAPAAAAAPIATTCAPSHAPQSLQVHVPAHPSLGQINSPTHSFSARSGGARGSHTLGGLSGSFGDDRLDSNLSGHPSPPHALSALTTPKGSQPVQSHVQGYNSSSMNGSYDEGGTPLGLHSEMSGLAMGMASGSSNGSSSVRLSSELALLNGGAVRPTLAGSGGQGPRPPSAQHRGLQSRLTASGHLDSYEDIPVVTEEEEAEEGYGGLTLEAYMSRMVTTPASRAATSGLGSSSNCISPFVPGSGGALDPSSTGVDMQARITVTAASPGLRPIVTIPSNTQGDWSTSLGLPSCGSGSGRSAAAGGLGAYVAELSSLEFDESNSPSGRRRTAARESPGSSSSSILRTTSLMAAANALDLRPATAASTPTNASSLRQYDFASGSEAGLTKQVDLGGLSAALFSPSSDHAHNGFSASTSPDASERLRSRFGDRSNNTATIYTNSNTLLSPTAASLGAGTAAGTSDRAAVVATPLMKEAREPSSHHTGSGSATASARALQGGRVSMPTSDAGLGLTAPICSPNRGNGSHKPSGGGGGGHAISSAADFVTSARATMAADPWGWDIRGSEKKCVGAGEAACDGWPASTANDAAQPSTAGGNNAGSSMGASGNSASASTAAGSGGATAGLGMAGRPQSSSGKRGGPMTGGSRAGGGGVGSTCTVSRAPGEPVDGGTSAAHDPLVTRDYGPRPTTRQIQSARPLNHRDNEGPMEREIDPSVWAANIAMQLQRPPSRQKPPPEALHLWAPEQKFGMQGRQLQGRPQTAAARSGAFRAGMAAGQQLKLLSASAQGLGGDVRPAARPPTRQKPPPMSLVLEQDESFEAKPSPKGAHTNAAAVGGGCAAGGGGAGVQGSGLGLGGSTRHTLSESDSSPSTPSQENSQSEFEF